jgi:AraC-like DNA-binding protein
MFAPPLGDTKARRERVRTARPEFGPARPAPRIAGVPAALLRTLRVESTVQAQIELRAPWGTRLSNRGHAAFFVITEGGGYVQLDGQPPPGLRVEAGSFFFVRPDQGYTIRDSPLTPAIPAERLFADLPPPSAHAGVWRLGGRGARTCAVFGCFDFEPDHPLLAALPQMLHRRGPDADVEWIDASLRLLAARAAAREAFECRLAEALALHVFRSHFARGDVAGAGLLADPQVALAVTLLHDRPEEPWTLDALARRVGVSRSVLAARFAKVVGEPALRHLRRWRLRQAERLLCESGLGIGEIAERVGYRAEAAFRRAFKRACGVGPGAFRRRNRAG